jgi:hypothetical protein
MYVVSSSGGLMVQLNKLYICDVSGDRSMFEIQHRGVGTKLYEYDVLAAYKTAREALDQMNFITRAIAAGEGVYRLVCSTADM